MCIHLCVYYKHTLGTGRATAECFHIVAKRISDRMCGSGCIYTSCIPCIASIAVSNFQLPLVYFDPTPWLPGRLPFLRSCSTKMLSSSSKCLKTQKSRSYILFVECLVSRVRVVAKFVALNQMLCHCVTIPSRSSPHMHMFSHLPTCPAISLPSPYMSSHLPTCPAISLHAHIRMAKRAFPFHNQ